MIRIERHVVVHRPLERIFAWFVDLPYDLKSDFVYSERPLAGKRGFQRMTPDPVGVGSVLTAPLLKGNAIRWVELQVTDFEENRIISMQSTTKAFPLKYWYKFEPVVDGTLITYVFEESITGRLRKLREPRITQSRSSAIDRALSGLKIRLETQLSSST